MSLKKFGINFLSEFLIVLLQDGSISYTGNICVIMDWKTETGQKKALKKLKLVSKVI